jgi:hypothetical protein
MIGDEARPAEEGQGIGQYDFMIAVVQVGDADADDDTAEDAFLEGHDAADIGNRTFQDIGRYGVIGQYFACQFEDGVGRGVHDEKGNHRPIRQATSFSCLAMPIATPTAKIIGKVAEDDIAGIAHDGEQ